MAYGNSRINFIMDSFTNYIGLEPNPKQQQRRYCQHIIKAVGDKTEDIVTYAIGIQSDYYAPRITSPKDLYYKLSKVMDYYKKHEADSGQVVNL